MDALSRWVLTFIFNSIWQVGLVLGAAALADVALRRAPARFRHALWVVALSAAVVLPAVSVHTLETPSRAVSTGAGILALSNASVHGVSNSGIVPRGSARRT